MLYLSRSGKGVLAKRKDIARAMEIPELFLGKIAQQLSRSGIIEIVQGAGGGFRLLIAPEKLTLLEVIEAVIGEIILNDCIGNPDGCYRSGSCSVHLVWEKAREQLRETLRQARFADLLVEDSCMTDMITPVENRSVSDSGNRHP
jgi:Rrf2 family protein